MTSATQFPYTNYDVENCFCSPRKVSTSEIVNFAKTADNLANQILSQDAPVAYQGPVVIRSSHYYHPSPFFWPIYPPSPSVVVINNGPHSSASPVNRDRNKEKDNGAAILVGIVAVAVGGIALYSLGAGIATYNDTNQELADTQQFQERLFIAPNADAKEQALIQEANNAANLKNRICTRLKNSALANLALRTGLFASCGIALAGAVAATPALMTAGGVVGLVSVGGMLFKWGFDTSDKANVRDAQHLKGSVQYLKTL